MIVLLLWFTAFVVFGFWFVMGSFVSLVVGALAILIPVGLLAVIFRGTEELSRLLPGYPSSSWPFLPRK
jgi:hypothetical protein